MQVREIIEIIERWAPPDTAESWDNVGMLVGGKDGETGSCLLALDVVPQTIPEARRCGASLIVSHHPVIFSPLTRVIADNGPGGIVLAAARAGVSIYCAHTNLDASLTMGTSAALADRLGLSRGPALVASGGGGETVLALTGTLEQLDAFLAQQAMTGAGCVDWPVSLGQVEGNPLVRREIALPPGDVVRLSRVAHDAGMGAHILSQGAPDAGFGLGMLTSVPEMTLAELSGYVARKLGRRQAAFVGCPDARVTRVALMPGSGGSLVESAAGRADVMITGEIKYHEAQEAEAAGLGVVVAGHYETERPVLDLLARALKQETAGQVSPAISQLTTDPFHWPEG